MSLALYFHWTALLLKIYVCNYIHTHTYILTIDLFYKNLLRFMWLTPNCKQFKYPTIIMHHLWKSRYGVHNEEPHAKV